MKKKNDIDWETRTRIDNIDRRTRLDWDSRTRADEYETRSKYTGRNLYTSPPPRDFSPRACFQPNIVTPIKYLIHKPVVDYQKPLPSNYKIDYVHRIGYTPEKKSAKKIIEICQTPDSPVFVKKCKDSEKKYEVYSNIDSDEEINKTCYFKI